MRVLLNNHLVISLDLYFISRYFYFWPMADLEGKTPRANAVIGQ